MERARDGVPPGTRGALRALELREVVEHMFQSPPTMCFTASCSSRRDIKVLSKASGASSHSSSLFQDVGMWMLAMLIAPSPSTQKRSFLQQQDVGASLVHAFMHIISASMCSATPSKFCQPGDLAFQATGVRLAAGRLQLQDSCCRTFVRIVAKYDIPYIARSMYTF